MFTTAFRSTLPSPARRAFDHLRRPPARRVAPTPTVTVTVTVTAGAPAEPCGLCETALAAEHRHLLLMENRRVVSACDACALCFEGVIGGRLRLIPRETFRLPGTTLSDASWRDLALPVGLAFFVRHSGHARTIALYPGPAGTMESFLPLPGWNDLTRAHPVIAAMQPDVEALLVHRPDQPGAAPRCYLAPIDVCFRLMGLVRLHWRGEEGGPDAWDHIARFFVELDSTALPALPARPAPPPLPARPAPPAPPAAQHSGGTARA